MPVDNPAALVEEFKKSGEFDRLRRELLAQFRDQDDAYSALKARVEEIGRQRLATDPTLQYQPNHDTIHKELMQEVERYPIVERAVADVRVFSDPTFLANVQGSIQKILNEGKGGGKGSPSAKGNETPLHTSSEATTKPQNESGGVPDVSRNTHDRHATSAADTNGSTDSKSPAQRLRRPSPDTAPLAASSSQAPDGDESVVGAGALSIPSTGAADSAAKSSEPSSSAPNPNTNVPIEESPIADIEMKDVQPGG